MDLHGEHTWEGVTALWDADKPTQDDYIYSWLAVYLSLKITQVYFMYWFLPGLFLMILGQHVDYFSTLLTQGRLSLLYSIYWVMVLYAQLFDSRMNLTPTLFLKNQYTPVRKFSMHNGIKVDYFWCAIISPYIRQVSYPFWYSIYSCAPTIVYVHAL